VEIISIPVERESKEEISESPLRFSHAESRFAMIIFVVEVVFLFASFN